MEFSEKVARGERLLLAGFLAALGAVSWLESRSSLATSIRSQQPWLAVLVAQPHGLPDQEFLLVYQPARRLLDLIYLPGPGDLASALAALPIAKTDSAAPMLAQAAAAWPELDPPLAARDWLLRRVRGRGFWKEAGAGFDRLLLAVEIMRLPPESLRASWLPDRDEDRRTFLARVLAPPSAQTGPGPNVEILNATGKPGVANAAKDVLRLQGVDVINVGNAPVAPRVVTVVYDRTGRAENAQAALEKLGCPDARAATQIKEDKLVDVTVILGADCAEPGRERSKLWNWSRY